MQPLGARAALNLLFERMNMKKLLLLVFIGLSFGYAQECEDGFRFVTGVDPAEVSPNPFKTE